MPKQLKPSKSIIPKRWLYLAIIFTMMAVAWLSVNLCEPTPSQDYTPADPSSSVQIKYPGKIPILMYHYVEYNRDPADTIRASLTVTPYWFETQLKWLLDNGYQTIDLDTLVSGLTNEGLLPKKPVVLTFDDGYRDFYTDAWPLLKKYQAKATVYIVRNFVDKHNYLTSEQIAIMATDSAQLITFGAHTNNHQNLKQIPLQAAWEEIKVGPLNHFCYPYGAHNVEVENLVKLAGYQTAVTTSLGLVDKSSDLFKLSRIRVGNYGGEQFKARLASQK